MSLASGLVVSLALSLVVPVATAEPSGASSPAQPAVVVSDRPGLTDATSTVGVGVVQVESGLDIAISDATEDLLFPLALRYGISSAWEVRLRSGVVSVSCTKKSRCGASAVDTMVGARYELAASRLPDWMPEAMLQGHLVLPTGLGRGWGAGDLGADLGVGTTFTLPSQFYVSTLTSFSTTSPQLDKRDNALLLAASLGRPAPELGLGDASLYANGGIAVALQQDTDLDFTVGIGAQWTFGRWAFDVFTDYKLGPDSSHTWLAGTGVAWASF